MGSFTVSLGSTRLSILDLSPAGHMPMHDATTDAWIVFNGEIYNFQEVRRELEADGFLFVSNSDTEVLLKAYLKWGAGCLDRLRGMFAFAIWDPTRQEVFIARDRMGEKPLYFYRDPMGKWLCFASEIRALFASGMVPARVDPDGLETYLFNGFLVSPLTMIHGVKSLLPGHWMRVNLQGEVIKIGSYWRLPVNEDISNTEDRANAFQTLQEAVHLRMRSDVPLGAFLSGGLDSSAIAALMAQNQVDLRTFSVSFNEKEYDESAYALWVAKRIGANHTEVLVDQDLFFKWIENALDAMDQPTFDGINSYFVSRAAKESGLTVALSGLGADEVFGGYPFFRFVPKLNLVDHFLRFIPIGNKWVKSAVPNWQLSGPLKLLELSLQRSKDEIPDLAAYQSAQVMFPFWMRERLNRKNGSSSSVRWGLPADFINWIAGECFSGMQMDRLNRFALRLFLGERCLRDTDTMSMGVSLEVRTVFTDHQWINSVMKIPAVLRCEGAPEKPFEWELFKDLLSSEYPYRKKQGFTFPFEKWLTGQGNMVREVVENPRLAALVGFDTKDIVRIADHFYNGQRVPWSRIWMLFILFRWCDKHGAALG